MQQKISNHRYFLVYSDLRQESMRVSHIIFYCWPTHKKELNFKYLEKSFWKTLRFETFTIPLIIIMITNNLWFSEQSAKNSILQSYFFRKRNPKSVFYQGHFSMNVGNCSTNSKLKDQNHSQEQFAFTRRILLLADGCWWWFIIRYFVYVASSKLKCV